MCAQAKLDVRRLTTACPNGTIIIAESGLPVRVSFARSRLWAGAKSHRPGGKRIHRWRRSPVRLKSAGSDVQIGQIEVGDCRVGGLGLGRSRRGCGDQCRRAPRFDARRVGSGDRSGVGRGDVADDVGRCAVVFAVVDCELTVSCTPSAKAAVLVPLSALRVWVVATPLMANLNGLLVDGSFSVKLTVAVRVPLAVGLNCTVKVVLPPAATKLAG